jgi:hypothetical protein
MAAPPGRSAHDAQSSCCVHGTAWGRHALGAGFDKSGIGGSTGGVTADTDEKLTRRVAYTPATTPPAIAENTKNKTSAPM